MFLTHRGESGASLLELMAKSRHRKESRIPLRRKPARAASITGGRGPINDYGGSLMAIIQEGSNIIIRWAAFTAGVNGGEFSRP
ncbi:hypothetical protein [Nocardia australiensis]|uniref:hypothetical protein n=1 Tax=Nocardia australiensis TaxID=2887191 RepID=UPI001D155BC1|nr:hypothetical protein [Nocardia australiensis]